jgi:hypothetical protein
MLTDVDVSQVINYLRASGFEKALPFNFGTSKLQIRRIVLTQALEHAGVDDQLIEATDLEESELLAR